MNQSGMTCRHFLKLSLTTSGSLMFAATLPAQAAIQAGIKAASAETFAPNFYLTLHRSGKLTLALTKLEMGQCPGVGYQALVAEELGLPLDRIDVEPIPYTKKTAPFYNQNNSGVTGGSRSIRVGWPHIRKAAASARQLLVQAAAQQLKVDAQECTTELGKVVHDPSQRSLAYENLIDTAATLDTEQETQQDVSLKPADEFRLIGRPVPNYLTQQIVTGTLDYGIDTVIDGMVFAAICRCPYIEGKVKTLDSSTARQTPGVIDIVRIDRQEIKDKEPLDAVLNAAYGSGLFRTDMDLNPGYDCHSRVVFWQLCLPGGLWSPILQKARCKLTAAVGRKYQSRTQVIVTDLLNQLLPRKVVSR